MRDFAFELHAPVHDAGHLSLGVRNGFQHLRDVHSADFGRDTVVRVPAGKIEGKIPGGVAVVEIEIQAVERNLLREQADFGFNRSRGEVAKTEGTRLERPVARGRGTGRGGKGQARLGIENPDDLVADMQAAVDAI